MTSEQILQWNQKNAKQSSTVSGEVVLKSDISVVPSLLVFRQNDKDARFSNCYISVDNLEQADKILSVVGSLAFSHENKEIEPNFRLFDNTLSISLELKPKTISNIVITVKQ